MTILFRFSCQQMEAKRISIENTANVVNFYQIIEKCMKIVYWGHSNQFDD